MRRCLTFIVVGMLCAGFVACQSGAAGLGDQDKAAIRKVVEDATKAMTSAKPDYAAYVNLYYTDGATILMPNTPPVKGRAAIQPVLASFPPMSEFKAEIVDLDGRGDLAYVRGNYSMTMTPPGAPPIMDKGKYVEVWKKQADGTWKADYDSWSSDLPVPGLLVPTGAMAANASVNVKKLGDIVGRWQIGGTYQPGPKSPAAPLSMTLDCQWFAGGRQVVCLYGGTVGSTPVQETSTYSYNPATRTYGIYNVSSVGEVFDGKVTIESGTWVHVLDTYANGKPAKQRLTLTNATTAGGDWKEEIAVAGGPWVPLGAGKYTRAK
jgi:ketosteroid isomerase-like protein